MMTPELTYFIKVNLALILLYGFYRLFFYKDTYFTLRRWVLLLFFVLAFSYPLFNMQEWVKAQEPIVEIIYAYSVMLPEVIVKETVPWTLTAAKIGQFIYILVAIGLFLRFAIQFGSIMRIKRRSKRAIINDTTVFLLPKPANPFSFFRAIFVYPPSHSEKELEEILTHEHTHVAQWHSIDVIISELIVIICWVNPFVWLLKREIRHNLEYLADNTVIHSGYDSRAYQFHLLGLAHQKPAAALFNSFNVLDLKNRITMMNKKRSSKAGRTKYLIFIPIILLLILLSNIESVSRFTKEITSGITASNDETTIEGTVADTDGKPIIGASVVVKGTNIGTITDLEGRYKLEAKENATLSFSSIGYQPVEATMNSLKSNPRIILSAAQANKEEGTVFTVVEEMPIFPGGDAELLQYIAKNVKYPQEAQEKGVQGRVIMSFIVNIDGTTSDHQIIRGVSSELDVEAIRVMTNTPLWTPGKQRGLPVRVKYTVPITFKLSNSTASNTTQEAPKPKESEHGLIYTVVEEMPKFPGGDEKLLAFIAKGIKYPIEAQTAGTQGRVICSFVVLKSGKIADVEVVRGVTQLLDEEAVRVIKTMPDWTPGKMKDSPVNVKYTVPITFRLQ